MLVFRAFLAYKKPTLEVGFLFYTLEKTQAETCPGLLR